MRSALVLTLVVGICGGDKKNENAGDTEAAAAETSAQPEDAAEVASDPPPDTKGKTKKPRHKKPRAEPRWPGMDATLARAIVRDDGVFTVEPFVATLVAETLAQTGGKPHFGRVSKEDVGRGVPRGYRVKKLKRDSLFHRLGLRDGDIVTKLGSAAPPGPKRLRKLLETVGEEVELHFVRDGKAATFRYRLAGGQSWRGYLETEIGRTLPDPSTTDDGGERTAANTKGSATRPSGTSGSSKPASAGKPSGGRGGSSASGSSSGGPVPVSCSSASTCTVAKSYFDKMVSSSSAMRSQAKVASASGGYKLTWVKPGSGVHKLRFRSGDVITRVNGRNLSNQLEALALYAGLKSTRTYRINYRRGSRSLSKTVYVK